MSKETNKVRPARSDNEGRITKKSIEALIEEVDYLKADLAGHTFIFCGIRMKNGFVAIGAPSTCFDPNQWKDVIGKEVAYNNSFEKLWQLEAYRRLSTVTE